MARSAIAAATGAPGGAETPLAITVNEIRDMDNAVLTGLIPDPGQIVVDLDAPAILDVLGQFRRIVSVTDNGATTDLELNDPFLTQEQSYAVTLGGAVDSGRPLLQRSDRHGKCSREGR